MSHNAKYYRKKLKSSTSHGSMRIDMMLKRANTSEPTSSFEDKQSDSNSRENSSSTTDSLEMDETVQVNNDEVEPTNTAVSMESLQVISEEVELTINKQETESSASASIATVKTVDITSKTDNRLYCAARYEQQFPWLYYSSARCGYICKFCEFWEKSGTKQPCSPFVEMGTQLGSHPTRKLEKHDKSENHQMASKMYHGEFFNSSKSVYQLLQEQHQSYDEEKKKKGRVYIETLIKTAYFMIKKRWALSDNLGEMIDFMGTELGMTQITDHLEINPNLKYTSHASVQEIVASISLTIEQETLEAVREATWYSLLADESSDEGNREQFAVIVRFVQNGIVKEAFLGLIHLHKTDAESLMMAIETFLLAKGVDITKAIFVGFDGCNTMSGVNSGLQRRFRNKVPHQIYINCRNHKLALCVKHLIKEFPILEQLDAMLIEIWKLFHYSPKKYEVFCAVQDLYNFKKLKMIKAATTRWLSHGRALARFLDRYTAILDAIDSIYDDKKDPELLGMRTMITDKKIIAVATILCDILKPVVVFSDYLQGDVHFSRVNTRQKELTDALQHLSQRFGAVAGGLNDQDLYFSRLPRLWEEIDDRTNFAHRLRNAGVFTMVQVAAELAEPMVNGLINEMDDAFHCSDVLQGFRVFELADIPSNLPDLMEYGEEKIRQLAVHYGRPLEDNFKGNQTVCQPVFQQNIMEQQFLAFRHQMFLLRN
uniref:E3 SUMO-protein ligase KIAA1586-like isoform X3 n=1 Tax=Crassostrea virginica TaxID=6565 RepID=A0A8B8EFG2_CRAVI|nr:E3 SUMO-protein ligase KIAA1586-like isoform X3 [Crassostrea virginica]